jgi:aspartate aminotransferase
VELCHAILEDTGVAMLPGYDFGCQPQDLTARIAYVDFDGQGAIGESKTNYSNQPIDARFLADRCPKIIEAFDRLGQWFDQL